MSICRVGFLVLLATIELLPLPLSAQAPAVPPGTRVRVQPRCGGSEPAPACTMLVGRAVRLAGDSLLVEDERGMIRGVDLLTSPRLERSAGYKRHTLLGLAVGSLVGVGTGALLASGCTRGGRGEDDDLCNLAYLVTVPAGAGIGTLVGALTRTERWVTISGSGAVLRVWPGVDRAAIVVTGRF